MERERNTKWIISITLLQSRISLVDWRIVRRKNRDIRPKIMVWRNEVGRERTSKKCLGV